MPSVGAVNFISLKGQSEPLGLVLQDVTRPGVNGSAYRKEGTRGQPYPMEGVVDCDSLAAGVTTYETLKALQGTVVSVTDDYGTTKSPLLLDVQRVDLKPIRQAVGGLSTSKQALLVVRFTFQRLI